MKNILAIYMMLAMSCSFQSSENEADDEAKRDETLENLVLMDPSSPNMPSYPLMCVEAGDYPKGVELIFQKQNDAKTWIHAVFPVGTNAPDKTEGVIVLKGRFRKIRNRHRFVHKKPPKGYQYFRVKSWQNKNEM
jgi:hypothetical protein